MRLDSIWESVTAIMERIFGSGQPPTPHIMENVDAVSATKSQRTIFTNVTSVQMPLPSTDSTFFPKTTRRIDRVFLHCSASDNPDHDDISIIRKWHLERGFEDVGYHYFIRKDGVCQIGRAIDKVPAAQAGHNKGTVAICLHGLKDFTEEQFRTLRTLCRMINISTNRRVTFHGHCEVSNKSCPVFDYVKVLGLYGGGRMPLDDVQ